jgi:hypothetical protein
MFPPDNPTSAPIILSCWFWSSNGWQEGRIEEASAASQTAVITPRNSLASLTVEFKHIQNVSLQYGFTGEVLESFGSPRTATPWLIESLPVSYGEIS